MLTRRQLLRAGAAGAAAAGLEAAAPGAVLDRLLAATPPRCGRLSDIDHVVIFMQENRSFDQYFGTYRGVRGFADPHALRQHDGTPVFSQPGYPSAGFGGRLYPFRLDTVNHNGSCTNDIDHSWAVQHRSWNGGAMDGFVREHVKAEGADRGAVTMGYYTREDLPFYHALANAFTLCDRHHCSVIGPTDPNQLYVASATLDPAGRGGGPIVDTFSASGRGAAYGSLHWTTMPDQLEARRISWKVYAASDNLSPIGDSPFPFFSQFQNDPALYAKAVAPRFPDDFLVDCASGALPSVSWVYASVTMSEHPPAPPAFGEFAAAQVLDGLLSNPAVWARTALFITYDENGGFFDHVPPPIPPAGTPGEELTVAAPPESAQGIRGPIGLGFRVPLLVVSPFSRGGLVCSAVSDHTSLLRFVEARFGAEVPNLSAWRRATTGDLTSAFNFAAAPDASAPTLPTPSASDPRVLQSNCPTQPVTLLPGLGAATQPYPAPPNAMPAQDRGTRARPSGLCGPHRLRLRLRRHRRRLADAYRVRVTIEHTAALKGVEVRLNGRRLRRTRRARLAITVRPRRLRRGRNTLTVVVRDATGAVRRRRLHFIYVPRR